MKVLTNICLFSLLASIFFSSVSAETNTNGLINNVKDLEQKVAKLTEQVEKLLSNQVFVGKTEPKIGFKKYIAQSPNATQSGWFIEIPYPQAVKDIVDATGKRPVITVSVGGQSRHVSVQGTSSVYTLGGAVKHPNGFSVILRPENFKSSTHTSDHEVWSHPVNHSWYINYMIAFES